VNDFVLIQVVEKQRKIEICYLQHWLCFCGHSLHQQRDVASNYLIFKDNSEDLKGKFAEYMRFIINPYQVLDAFK